MGQCIIMTGGSAGDTSDDCTASKSHVLEGYKAITNDSGDEAATGTMPNRGIGSCGASNAKCRLVFHDFPSCNTSGVSDFSLCTVNPTISFICSTAGIVAR